MDIIHAAACQDSGRRSDERGRPSTLRSDPRLLVTDRADPPEPRGAPSRAAQTRGCPDHRFAGGIGGEVSVAPRSVWTWKCSGSGGRGGRGDPLALLAV